MQADLTQPGSYKFEVFTLLEEDSDSSNDTVSVTVVSVPRIIDYPYLADFETDAGFWRPERGGRGPASWMRGRPRGKTIDRAGAGEFAYVTNPRGDYNNRELSYLRSPCFNFSGFAADPYLSFLLYVDTEVNFDQLSLQSSVDDGSTWQTVERNPTAINWYNNGRDQAWEGDGGFGGGYALVGQQLDGLAGQENVQLRFVFRSDGDGQRDGVAIDNIRIAPASAVDLAAASATLPGFSGCGSGADTLTFSFVDIGLQRVDSAVVTYRILGGATGSTAVTAPLTRGGRRTVRLPITDLNVVPPAAVTIDVWVEAVGDTLAFNDTIRLIYQPTRELPFLVDFEDGRLPIGWEADGDLTIGTGAGPTTTLSDLLFAQDTIAEFRTAYYGPFTRDSLSFNVDLSPDVGSTDIAARIRVMAEVACDSNLVQIIDTEYTGERLLSVSLAALDGQVARLFISVTRTAGDFTVSFDNISVRRCPANLGIKLTTVAPNGIFADDGEAFLEPSLGLAPYTYAWSTGDTTQSVDSLSVGEYRVTVTDALGCTDSRDVTVDLQAVGTDEPGALLAGLAVFPNPTGGRVDVKLSLPTVVNVALEVYDARGRRLEIRALGAAAEISTTVDLSDYPVGLYFLRVRAGEVARTVRVLRQ